MDNKTNKIKIIYLQPQKISPKFRSSNRIKDKQHYFICIRQRRIAIEQERFSKKYIYYYTHKGKYKIEVPYRNKASPSNLPLFYSVKKKIKKTYFSH